MPPVTPTITRATALILPAQGLRGEAASPSRWRGLRPLACHAAGPQSGEPSQFRVRVTGLTPVPSELMTNTSGRPAPIAPREVANTIELPSGEKDPVHKAPVLVLSGL